uniref:Uncharacterized protein n=1 Tax=Chenopodium quinoa TaxID=63459 RepID=A0A803LJS8_CHEQI
MGLNWGWPYDVDVVGVVFGCVVGGCLRLCCGLIVDVVLSGDVSGVEVVIGGGDCGGLVDGVTNSLPVKLSKHAEENGFEDSEGIPLRRQDAMRSP